jgi:alkanesulfonate monooxygenase SsuD/methylene tetrahydromethanopterin reductase-like flavin-dependent oxidoreductase (luciferase family)
VMFETKPVQQPHPPLHIGGESQAALRRAARIGDGWIGMERHTFASITERIAELQRLRADYDRGSAPFQVSIHAAALTPDDIERWTQAGVDRLFIHPWSAPREAISGLREFAATVGPGQA